MSKFDEHALEMAIMNYFRTKNISIQTVKASIVICLMFSLPMICENI